MALIREYFYEIEDRISYPILGAFTAFLIGSYGMEKYKEAYQNDDEWVLAFRRIYEKELQNLENEFMNWVLLKTYSVEQIESARKELL